MDREQFRYTTEGLCLDALNFCKSDLICADNKAGLQVAARFVLAAGLFREIVPDMPKRDIYQGTPFEQLSDSEHTALYIEVKDSAYFTECPGGSSDNVDRFIDVFLGDVYYSKELVG